MILNRYINSFEGDVKDRLIEFKDILSKIDANITSDIVWGLPTFYYDDSFLFQLKLYNNSIGFCSSANAIDKLKEDLPNYEQLKVNTINFPLEKKLPKELIKENIYFRISEINS